MPWQTLRIAIIYGPVWLTIIVTFTIYLRLGLYIYFQLKQLRAVEMSGDWAEHVNRIADPSVTELQAMEPTVSQQHSQADQSGTLTQQAASAHSINSHSGASGSARASSHSTMAAWAYTRYAFLFFLALLVTWVCYFISARALPS